MKRQETTRIEARWLHLLVTSMFVLRAAAMMAILLYALALLLGEVLR